MAGNIAIQASDAKVYNITAEAGAASNVSVVVPKDGGKLAADVLWYIVQVLKQ